MLTVRDDRIVLVGGFRYKEIAKAAGMSFNGEAREWSVPLAPKAAAIAVRMFPDDIFDPATLHFFASAKKQHDEDTEVQELLRLAKSDDSLLNDLTPPFRFKTVPYRHQQHAWLYGVYKRRVAYLLEMGLGKTKVTIDDWRYHHSEGDCKRCLIVAPSSLVWNWYYEFLKHADEYEPHVLIGSRAKKARRARACLESDVVTIVNYEALQGYAEAYTTFDFVVFDESTRIKNPGAQRSKAAAVVADNAEFVRLLTGTPVARDLFDLYGQFLVLDGGATFGRSFFDFRRAYLQNTTPKAQFPTWRPQIGAEERANKLLLASAVRYTKSECLDLPERTFADFRLKLSKEQRRVYKRVRSEILDRFRGAKVLQPTEKIVQLLRLAQITGGFVATEDGNKCFDDNVKLDALMDIVEAAEGHKIIVWCRFREEVSIIQARLAKSQVPVLMLTGDTKESMRQEVVRSFQDDADKCILIATPHVGGFGLTLTASDVTVWYSIGFDYEVYRQACDRNHRIGQTRNVEYIHLVCENTVDEHILRNLSSKGKLADLVTGDKLPL